jgi:D-alanyl-D-alanine carboxypeptidase
VSDLRVLQQARQSRAFRESERRRRRRRRRARRAGTVLLLAAATLLAVLVATTSGPVTPAPSATAASTAHASSPPPRAPHTSYGRLAAAVQVHPRLRLPVRSGLLFDVRTGRVLWQRDPTRQLAIASLTKMMTGLVVLTHSRPSDRVLITRAAVDFSGSGVGMLPRGKDVSERALLYGLLLPSGNDAAIALAEHVAGSQRNFIAMMNARAHAMGLGCTHFSTVSGVIDQGNRSCAIDLAVIAHAVLTQRTLAPIVAARSAILPFPIKGHKLYLYNNNPLLRIAYPGADGVKTGYTDAAGLCIVATAKRGRTWLGVVLLHSGNWQDQAVTLLNAGFHALATAPRPPRR